MDEEELPEGLKALAAELDALCGGANVPAVDALPDLEGSDFRPLALVGRGGMGAVYVARQLSLDREVAVKVLSPTLARDGESRARFLAEARTVARLHHPNIVQTIAAGEANGRLYFAMERVKGETASEHGFARWEDLVSCGIRVADALVYVHACGVVHRDVKPSNVFIGSEGAVKLGDFGLAVLAKGLVRDRGGTEKYMAPEQRTCGMASAKSDQYSFGVTMLELAASFPALLWDRDFAAILDKATAEDPEARYPDMSGVAADLGRLLRHEPVAARPAGMPRRLLLWAWRNPVAAGGVAVAVVLFVALVASLAIGYVRTSRALASTEREAENTSRALLAAFMATPTEGEPSAKGLNARRLIKLKVALKTVEDLSLRYPKNKEFPAAAERLRKAIRFTEMHGKRFSPPHRENNL